jgi:hypothetical protein
MCLRRAPEKYIAGAALDRADVEGPLRRTVEQLDFSKTHFAKFTARGANSPSWLWRRRRRRRREANHNYNVLLIVVFLGLITTLFA